MPKENQKNMLLNIPKKLLEWQRNYEGCPDWQELNLLKRRKI